MRTLTPLALIALIACHGADLDALPDTDATVDVGTTGEVSAASVGPVKPPAPLVLSEKLGGDKVIASKIGPWRSRTVGAMERESTGWGGMGGMMKRADYAPSAPSGAMDDRVYEAEAARPVASLDATAPMGAVAQSSPSLRAGTTDDNEEYGSFLSFMDTWSERPEVGHRAQLLDVRDRRFVEVLDATGAPLPGVPLAIRGALSGKTLWSGTTYGDGRAPFYPHLIEASDEPLAVTAQWHGVTSTSPWSAEGDTLSVTLDARSVQAPVKLDVVFLIDTTGSMGDELQRVQETLLATTQRIRGLDRKVDLQYGAVLYRDIGDEYLTRALPLTRDVDAFDGVVQGIRADGGGDGPESLNQGLAVAIGDTDWRSDAAKVVFLIADAPPHMDYQGDTPYGTTAAAALARGVRVHTVAASGLDDFGSLAFRQTAQLTRGKFIFIEYGSTAASAADHGVTGRVSSNNLDAILFEQLRSEIEGWGRRAPTVATR